MSIITGADGKRSILIPGINRLIDLENHFNFSLKDHRKAYITAWNDREGLLKVIEKDGSQVQARFWIRDLRNICDKVGLRKGLQVRCKLTKLDSARKETYIANDIVPCSEMFFTGKISSIDREKDEYAIDVPMLENVVKFNSKTFEGKVEELELGTSIRTKVVWVDFLYGDLKGPLIANEAKLYDDNISNISCPSILSSMNTSSTPSYQPRSAKFTDTDISSPSRLSSEKESTSLDCSDASIGSTQLDSTRDLDVPGGYTSIQDYIENGLEGGNLEPSTSGSRNGASENDVVPDDRSAADSEEWDYGEPQYKRQTASSSDICTEDTPEPASTHSSSFEEYVHPPGSFSFPKKSSLRRKSASATNLSVSFSDKIPSFHLDEKYNNFEQFYTHRMSKEASCTNSCQSTPGRQQCPNSSNTPQEKPTPVTKCRSEMDVASHPPICSCMAYPPAGAYMHPWMHPHHMMQPHPLMRQNMTYAQPHVRFYPPAPAFAAAGPHPQDNSSVNLPRQREEVGPDTKIELTLKELHSVIQETTRNRVRL